MRIFIDADACHVVRHTEEVAKIYDVPVTLLCDTNHILASDYSEIRIIGAEADAVDFALINLCKTGDIVITQDFGVAAMTLGKGAYAIHQDGWQYTDKNIDRLLAERHMAKKARRASPKTRFKGQRKRTEADNERFVAGLIRLLDSLFEHDNDGNALFFSHEKY